MRHTGRVDKAAGFTIIELMVALVVLTVIATSLGLAIQQVTSVIRRSRLELGAAAFLVTEVSQLRETPWDELASGSRTRGDSVATWTVSDSGGARRILLVTGHTSATGTMVALDSTLVVRLRSP